jgi:hypothetical protein
MGSLKKDFKYKLVKNFFSKEEIEIGTYYLLLMHKRNRSHFDFQQNNCGDSKFYSDCFTDTLLMKKTKLMEQETGLKLFPTYAFSRVYSYNADLKPHKDRPSCEVSVTAMWGSDGKPWPIYMEDTPIEMKPGDAVIYLGCELNHYRYNFKGDWHAQTFFHYVDQNGPFAGYKFDRRHAYIDPEV